ncbi:MAG: hypothetical protein ACOH13_15720 [Flavobacteriales bacterium]
MRTSLFALAAVLAATCSAQDSLFYSNGNIIVGQVEEIGTDAVTYRTSSSGNALQVTVAKQELLGLKLKEGQLLTFAEGGMGAAYSAAFASRKNAITFDVIAPALNHITIGYERVLDPGLSLVLKAGYIGLQKNKDLYSEVYNAEGGLFTAGLRINLPRSSARTLSPSAAHPFAGWYLRPELLFSAWTRKAYPHHLFYDPYVIDQEWRSADHFISTALVLNVGRSWFLGEHITFDISGGLGYGAQWSDRAPAVNGAYGESYDNYVFTHSFMGGIAPLVVCGGVRFGYVF